MKNQLNTNILTIFVAFTLLSCSKIDNVTPTGSRAIKYEITGNFAGVVSAVVTTNNDDFEIIEIKKLPWKLEFTAKQSIISVGGSASGSGGASGQTAILKTCIGGQEVSTGAGTALSSGYIFMTNKIYHLK